MEFLVKFEVNVPKGVPESEVQIREQAEARAAAELAQRGHLIRVWKLSAGNGGSSVLGLYRAETETDLDALLKALPLYDWMDVTVTPLENHPNDPLAIQPTVPVAGRG